MIILRICISVLWPLRGVYNQLILQLLEYCKSSITIIATDLHYSTQLPLQCTTFLPFNLQLLLITDLDGWMLAKVITRTSLRLYICSYIKECTESDVILSLLEQVIAFIVAHEVASN